MNDRELYGVIKALKEARYQVSPEKFQLKNKIMKDIAEKFLFPYIDYDFFEVTVDNTPGRLSRELSETYRMWRNNPRLITFTEPMERAPTKMNISFEVFGQDVFTEYYILSNLVNALFMATILQDVAEDQICRYYHEYGDENERTSRVTTFMLKLAASGVYPIHHFIDLLASMGDSMPKKTMARVQNERQKFIQHFDVAEQFSL